MSAYDDRPYEVGKGKPPKDKQFKKGQSGNPKGAKRRASIVDMTARQMVADIINEIIPVRIGDREVRLPKKYAILVGIVHDSLSGTANQRLKAFDALHKFGAFDLTPIEKKQTPDEYEAAIAGIVAELAEEAERDYARQGLIYDRNTGALRNMEDSPHPDFH